MIASLGFNCTLTNDEIELGIKSLHLAYREFAQMSQKYPRRTLLGGLVYPEVRRAHQAARDLKNIVRKTRQRYLENRLREELRKLPIHKRRDCLALKHCTREGMRLRPAAAIGGLRITSEDIAFESGCVIEKGSITYILNLALQRDADVYEKPDEFFPR